MVSVFFMVYCRINNRKKKGKLLKQQQGERPKASSLPAIVKVTEKLYCVYIVYSPKAAASAAAMISSRLCSRADI